jgi:predicted NUDIX family NTP pyrophosphohydrolase
VKISCGILPYRIVGDDVEFLLGQPPQRSYWTIMKGGKNEGESDLQAAKREFAEEALNANFGAFDGDIVPNLLLTGRTKGGKELKIFLAKWNWDVDRFVPNTQDDYVINKGSFAGQPEIVDVKWYKSDMALLSVPGSQAPIINQALEFLKQ